MKFIYRGEFSKNTDSQTVMGVTFHGREPVEVTDVPAINWLSGHPEYEAVPEVVEEAEPKPVKTVTLPKPRKKKATK